MVGWGRGGGRGDFYGIPPANDILGLKSSRTVFFRKESIVFGKISFAEQLCNCAFRTVPSDTCGDFSDFRLQRRVLGMTGIFHLKAVPDYFPV